MVMKFTNNATSTLASGINNSVTSLSVQAGAGALFPTLGAGDYFYCTLANSGGNIEIVKVTARTTDTFTIVRGQDGTTAQSWLAGDKVELRLVAASLNDFPKLDEANTFTQAPVFSSPLLTASGGTGTATPGAAGLVLTSNGTNWTSGSPITKVTATGGSTFFDFAIPSTVQRITINISPTTTNASHWLVQLISNVGVVNTNYIAVAYSSSGGTSETTGWGFRVPTTSSIAAVGTCSITLEDTVAGTSRYCMSGSLVTPTSSPVGFSFTTGYVSLPAGTTLAGVRVTSTTGSTFSGSMVAYYEY